MPHSAEWPFLTKRRVPLMSIVRIHSLWTYMISDIYPRTWDRKWQLSSTLYSDSINPNCMLSMTHKCRTSIPGKTVCTLYHLRVQFVLCSLRLAYGQFLCWQSLIIIHTLQHASTCTWITLCQEFFLVLNNIILQHVQAQFRNPGHRTWTSVCNCVLSYCFMCWVLGNRQVN